MDASEFEFPPDLLDDDVAGHLPVSPPNPSTPQLYAYAPESLPLSVLAQTPVDHLPPTRPNNPQNFSIGQVMRGALSTVHVRPRPTSSTSGGSAFSRPTTGVAPPPDSSTHPRAPASLAHSSYLSAALPQPLAASAPEAEEQRGGAENSFHQSDVGNESAHDVSSSSVGETTQPMAPAAGRSARIEWSEGEVRSFYQALSQFGTDFSAIAVLFPRRSRSDIKRLYQRELRMKPKEVQLALNSKTPIDMKAFKERHEAKKKEEQVPVKTKKLNVEELALMDEIESGLQASASPLKGSNEERETVLPPAALEAGEEATAAPTTAKPRKRKREAVVEAQSETFDATGAHKGMGETLQQRDSENESLFDLLMRRSKEDHMPLDTLFAAQPTSFEDSEFTFE